MNKEGLKDRETIIKTHNIELFNKSKELFLNALSNYNKLNKKLETVVKIERLTTKKGIYKEERKKVKELKEEIEKEIIQLIDYSIECLNQIRELDSLSKDEEQQLTTIKNKIKGIEVLKCKCGNIYAGCVLWDRGKDWQKEVNDALKIGHTVEIITEHFEFKECTCKKK